MNIIATIFCLILGIIYYPLNLIYIKVQKWYLPTWKRDKVIYFAFAPFYWILVGIVTIISVPFEEISKFVH